MYRILLPTDFSRNSIHAIDYVLGHFKSEHVEPVLLHVIRSPHSAAGVLIRIDGLMRRDAEEEMKKLTDHIQQKHGHRPETIIKIGSLSEWVRQNAEAYNIDLVAMGTKGETNISSKLMGSVTESVVRTARIPVLAIPMLQEDNGMHHVVVATPKESIPQRDIVKEFLLALKLDQLKLNILRVCKEETSGMPRNVALNGYQVGVETVVNPSAVDGINEYLDVHHTDLLIIYHKRNSKLDYFFNRSVTKTICSRTEVPLLVIPAN